MKKIVIQEKELSKKIWINQYDELLDIALDVKNKAYNPYSQFSVGAVLLDKNGNVYTGCNIENASYNITCCAERTALFKAVSEGTTDFQLIMIVANQKDKAGSIIAAPCGVCRQALNEFVDPNNFYVVLPEVGKNNKIIDYQINTLYELLPYSFSKANLR